ncbi:type II toxin-antitoxin system tRNA(fMet)-specific endonuclease VapC [Coraliomargarita parva]|uniref:type II toxin-antitoxin system tRNA(fMet)-specific endonuclease VapC n=1 Tax=Coraliomargarita parva TaxID=3014050 RepID=UPI0022B4F1CF|nr:type II toxin-antitoxin system VapC family toxin [Coraliomargarita parva]
MKYLLDTNTCIFIINHKPECVRQKMQSIPIGDIGVSSVTVSELEYGVAKSAVVKKNQSALEKFLMPLEIIAYDESAARYYGVIRTQLEKKGTPIGSMDLMIAAHALSLGMAVVTNNLREFKRVQGLKVEDWTKA